MFTSTQRRRKRRLKILIAAAVAGGAGLACYFVPEPYQPVCHFCAKILGIAFGGG